jgi:hypothetical protein
VTSSVNFETTNPTGVLNVSKTVAWGVVNNLQLCLTLGGACPNINSLCTSGAATTCGTFVTVYCRSTKVRLMGLWICPMIADMMRSLK